MRTLSNTTGPVSYGETSWETGNTPEAFTGKSAAQELISQANTVPLENIFKYYGVRADNGRNNIPCPFKSHQNGHESSASFRFYPDTNSFKCYGCGLGGYYSHSCEFVAAMDGITKAKAAYKILDLFGDDVDGSPIIDQQDFSERLDIMLSLSNMVREFRHSNIDDQSTAFIEYICLVYDDMNLKHKLDNDALRRFVQFLQGKIASYTSCLTL